MPTRPLPSPTATRALKENRRPPFTTLATRLIATTFSTMSLGCSRSRSRRGPPRHPGRPARPPRPPPRPPPAAAAWPPRPPRRRLGRAGVTALGAPAPPVPRRAAAAFLSRLPSRTPIRLRARRRRPPARDHGNDNRPDRTPLFLMPAALAFSASSLPTALPRRNLALAVHLDTLAAVAHAEEGDAAIVVHQLGVDVLERAEHRPGAGRAAVPATFSEPEDAGGTAAPAGSWARESYACYLAPVLPALRRTCSP